MCKLICCSFESFGEVGFSDLSFKSDAFDQRVKGAAKMINGCGVGISGNGDDVGLVNASLSDDTVSESVKVSLVVIIQDSDVAFKNIDVVLVMPRVL